MRNFCIVFLASIFIPNLLIGQVEKKTNSPDSLYKLAGRLLDENKVGEAVRIYCLLEKDPNWSKDPTNLRKTYNNLGYSYYSLMNFDSSLFYYQKSNRLAVSLGDTSKIIESFNSLALSYSNLGLYGLSLENSQAALAVAEAARNVKAEANIQNTMALMYYSLGDISSSLQYHRLSLAKATQLGDSIMMSFGLNNIARCYERRGQHDSSLFNNKKALEIKRRLSMADKDVVTTLNNIGSDYLKLDSLYLAEQYLNESNSIYRILDNRRGLVISFNNLADLAIARGQFFKAKEYLDSGAVILDHIKAKDLFLEYLERRVALMEKMGRHVDALKYQKDLAALKEEIFQEEKLNVQKVESAYLLKKKEQERENANLAAALAQEESRRNSRFIVFLFLGLMIAIFLSIVFLRLNRKLKASNLIVQAQKQDLKHSTYNTLMRIQALLRMTSDGIADNHTKEKLKQAEASIIAAASLQHFTYQIENESTIALGKFLEQLMIKLKEAFVVSDSPKISYLVEIEHEEVLPVETVLNLGMIVGEIVSNAMKHAFNTEIEDAKISLKLKKSGENIQVQVADNGVGLDREKIGIGVGTGLMQRLARYIKADLTVSNHSGTTYTIKLKSSHV